jgi:hypothetical protein
LDFKNGVHFYAAPFFLPFFAPRSGNDRAEYGNGRAVLSMGRKNNMMDVL